MHVQELKTLPGFCASVSAPLSLVYSSDRWGYFLRIHSDPDVVRVHLLNCGQLNLECKEGRLGYAQDDNSCRLSPPDVVGNCSTSCTVAWYTQQTGRKHACTKAALKHAASASFSCPAMRMRSRKGACDCCGSSSASHAGVSCPSSFLFRFFLLFLGEHLAALTGTTSCSITKSQLWTVLPVMLTCVFTR